MNDKSLFKLSSNDAGALFGTGLILTGILFLIGQFVSALFDLDLAHYIWPFFQIIPGLLLFITSFAFEPRPGITLAIIGGVVVMTGAILLIQSAFNLYATWAYAWALVAPTSIGLTKLVYGSLRGLQDEVKSGWNLAWIGFAILLFGALFFELGVGLSGFHFGAAWLCWPVLLIGLGVVVLLSNVRTTRTHSSADREGQQ
jgi:hypothetical protein